MSEFLNDAATAQRAREVIRMLIAARDGITTGHGPLTEIEFEDAHEPVAPAAWSWWMLVIDSARNVLDETDKGNGYLVAPVMRSIVNHAMGLKWLVDGGETALKALDAYSDPKLIKLIENAERVSWDAGGPVKQLVQDAIDARAASPDPEVKKLTNEISAVETLMVAYGVPEGYLPYRHLSSYSHTTRETAQLYSTACRSGRPRRTRIPAASIAAPP